MVTVLSENKEGGQMYVGHTTEHFEQAVGKNILSSHVSGPLYYTDWWILFLSGIESIPIHEWNMSHIHVCIYNDDT